MRYFIRAPRAEARRVAATVFRRATRRFALALGLLLPALPWQPAQAAPPLKVGVIGPFSGPSSDFGLPMLQGVQLAVAEINAV